MSSFKAEFEIPFKYQVDLICLFEFALQHFATIQYQYPPYIAEGTRRGLKVSSRIWDGLKMTSQPESFWSFLLQHVATI